MLLLPSSSRTHAECSPHSWVWSVKMTTVPHSDLHNAAFYYIFAVSHLQHKGEPNPSISISVLTLSLVLKINCKCELEKTMQVLISAPCNIQSMYHIVTFIIFSH